MTDRPFALASIDVTPLPRESAVLAYAASMPRTYRQLFNDDAIRVHAAIVAKRRESATHVAVWRELPERIVGLCVVADDVDGLLARIGAAFVAHDLDVIAAQAYCRARGDGRVEAVDFFWVRRLAPATGAPIPVRARDVASFGETLDTLVRGRATFGEGAPFPRGPSRASAEPTRVRFDADPRDGSLVLTVQGADRRGLLFLITEALFRERVRIARSDLATHEGRVLDRFHLTERDGSPLRRARLLGIQTAVLAAIDPVDRGDPWR